MKHKANYLAFCHRLLVYITINIWRPLHQYIHWILALNGRQIYIKFKTLDSFKNEITRPLGFTANDELLDIFALHADINLLPWKNMAICKPMSVNGEYTTLFYITHLLYLTSVAIFLSLGCRSITDDVSDHARALCPLKPWWAVLGSRYLSNRYSSYPDTSVFLRPLAVLLFTFPVITKFSRPCLLMTCPRKLSCRWRIVFISVCCTPAATNTSNIGDI